MRLLGLMIAAAFLGWTAPAGAEVVIAINKSQQSMTVSINGAPTYHWTVSTGRPGRDTPVGTYTAQRLERVFTSKKFDDAPMPNSIFFYGGYAIHGTPHEGQLGTPVSHGCVRLARANAATLFALVRAQGLRNTRVLIIDGPRRREPRSIPMASERSPAPIQVAQQVVQQVGQQDVAPGARAADRSLDPRDEPRYSPRSDPRYAPRDEPRYSPRSDRRDDLRDDPRDRSRMDPRRDEPRYDPRRRQASRNEPRYVPQHRPRYEPRYSVRRDQRYAPRRQSRYEPRYDPRYDPRRERRYEPRRELMQDRRHALMREYEQNARRQAQIERELGPPPRRERPPERPRYRDRYSSADGLRW